MDSRGLLIDYQFRNEPILNDIEEIIAIFGLYTNISERKKYETSLKEYGERINNVLESITGGFLSLNEEGEVTYWS